jgi:type I restriction enzyme R subunit
MPKPLPVGVLEARKENEDPLKGMQQAKGYADCQRFEVKYVFATNGHKYGEYDFFSQLQGGPFPFPDFPAHPDLTARYAKDLGIDITRPDAEILFQADSPAWSQSRYYQDAAIRAAFEKIIRCRQASEPARVLLTLATGAGKTIIAANLLWRLSQAGQLPKPALFLCDRDELREQAYTKLKAAFGDNARIVKTENGGNAAANARIHVATYQTLGLDDEEGFASFLTEHYGEDAFSVIIIDECHRSAWGKWSEVLKRNPNAIHIGLTATPRKLAESKHASAEDQDITANNLKYFGEPVYEYTLIQAQEDGYLAACEIIKRKASIDSRVFTKQEILAAKVKDIRTGKLLTEADLTRDEYTGKDFDDELFIELRTPKMCEDLFRLLCQNGGPEQKVIIFCTREIHADRVAQHMNNLYVRWCREKGRTPKDRYAFKCMGGLHNGADMIEPMRGSGERAFIACTVDLLEAGVDIERLNAVVFFRYLQSPIKFYQMVGRGTRIHEETGKYKFWLYDYTDVTQLFGTDFITKPPRPGGGGGGDGGNPAAPHSLVDVLDEVKQGIGKAWAEYPVLGATRDGLAPAKEQPGKQASKYKPAFPGTVFYNPMRILIGSIAFVDEDDTPGITSPDYVALQGKAGLIDSRWFYYWLRSPLGVKCINSLARGAVRERMLFNRLAEGEIELPEFAVQQKASQALKELKSLRRAIETKLAEIDLLPQKILAQAFEISEGDHGQ